MLLDTLRIAALFVANASLVWAAIVVMRRAGGDPVYPIPDGRVRPHRALDVPR